MRVIKSSKVFAIYSQLVSPKFENFKITIYQSFNNYKIFPNT